MLESILINLTVTIVAYLAVPVVFCLRGEKMTRNQIKKISIINGCCVCFAFIVLRAILEIKGSSGAVALWTPIGYWIMSRKLLIPDGDCKVHNTDNNITLSNIDRAKRDEKINVDIPKTNNVSFKIKCPQTICFCRKCGNKLVPNAVFCNKCGVKIDKF